MYSLFFSLQHPEGEDNKFCIQRGWNGSISREVGDSPKSVNNFQRPGVGQNRQILPSSRREGGQTQHKTSNIQGMWDEKSTKKFRSTSFRIFFDEHFVAQFFWITYSDPKFSQDSKNHT